MSAQNNQDDAGLANKDIAIQVQFEQPISDAKSRNDNSFNYLRYIVVILGGMVVGAMLTCRLSINVALLSMVNKTAIYLTEHPNSTAEEFFPPDYVEAGIFEWNHEIQQLIMTGYMVAYALPQYATTKLSLKYGLRRSVPISVVTSSISCLLIPYFSHWGWKWALALRLINGIGASAIYPTMFSVIELWMPAHQRDRGLAILQFTQAAINCFIPWVSGLLTSIHWKWAFYVPTIIGLTISLLWYIIVADEPATSKLISQKEYKFIIGHKESDEWEQNNDNNSRDKNGGCTHRTDVPWYFVFKIKSFYYFSVAFILLDATASGFLYILPTYINRVLKLSVDDVGLVYSIVQVGSIFCLLCPNPAAEFLQQRFKLSLTSARNLMTGVCCLMVASTFSYLAFLHEDLILILTINRFFHVALDFIVLTTLMSQFSSQGLSGLVFSVINALANLGVLASCWTVGRVLDLSGNSLESWCWVLNVFGAMMTVYFIIYVIFLKSKPIHVDLKPIKTTK